MRAITSVVFALSSLSLVACGDDGASTPIDGPRPIDGPPVACSVSTAMFGDKGALTGNATFRANPNVAGTGDMTFVAPLEGTTPPDILIFQLFSGYSPFGTTAAPTAVVPGTYQITGPQLEFADCGVCVRIGTNATATAVEDDYMATGGTVTVDTADSRVGGTLTFSLSNVTFEHVTINDMSVSNPVGDGCESALQGATGSATLAAPATKPGVQAMGPGTKHAFLQ